MRVPSVLRIKKFIVWGKNDTGQLGRGTVSAANAQEEDASGEVVNLRAKQVAAGLSHACAIATDDTIKCWGASNVGQLGDGKPSATPVPTPQLALNIAGAVNVSASNDFTCATLTDGTARCWGSNLPSNPDAGPLGVGTLISSGGVGPRKPDLRSTPTVVKGLSGVKYISTGTTHACASGFGGIVYCWGSNQSGELLHGTITNGTLAP